MEKLTKIEKLKKCVGKMQQKIKIWDIKTT